MKKKRTHGLLYIITQIEEPHDLKLQYLSFSDSLAYMIKFSLVLKRLPKEVCILQKGWVLLLGGKTMGT